MPDIEVVGVESLQQLVATLRGDAGAAPACPTRRPSAGEPVPDLADVRGHNGLIPGLEVAAAGGHNLFLQGPPGTGKTMIARRLPSILPPLGARGGDRGHAHPVDRRPARGGAASSPRGRSAPRTTRSRPPGLVGGANPPQPGEATLAHRGVLFLDELSEFARPSLEALRQPLEDGHVTIVRGQQVMVFPTRFMLVAASNPCPCGLGGARCSCTQADLARHRRRLSGPLLDRIDILMRVERPPSEALRRQVAPVLGHGPRARRRRPRAPGAPPRRPAARPATPSSPRARSARSAASRRAPSACSASSTTATRSRPAATRASCASPAPSPTSTAPTSSAPSTSTSPRACASTTATRSRRRHDRVRRLPAPDRPDRGDRRAAPDRVQAARRRPRARCCALHRRGLLELGADGATSPAPLRRGFDAPAARARASARRAGDRVPLPRRVPGAAARPRRPAGGAARARRPGGARRSRTAMARRRRAARVVVRARRRPRARARPVGRARSRSSPASRWASTRRPTPARSRRPGRTIGVLAGERAHRRTRRAAGGCTRRSRARGAVISEMPPGAQAHRWCFVARNRIIAALGGGDGRRPGHGALRAR